MEVCSRCGAFACAECTDYLDARTPVCASCRELLRRGAPGWRGRLGVWAAGAGVVGMLVGLKVPGRSGLGFWVAAAPVGLAGAVLSLLELRRLRREGAGPGGQRLARLGLALGVLHGALVLVLAVAFLAFLRLHRDAP